MSRNENSKIRQLKTSQDQNVDFNHAKQYFNINTGFGSIKQRKLSEIY